MPYAVLVVLVMVVSGALAGWAGFLEASATLGSMRLTGQMMSLGLATLMIHLFIGEAQITPASHTSFVLCVKWLFIIFGALSILGVFASLARGKKVSG